MRILLTCLMRSIQLSIRLSRLKVGVLFGNYLIEVEASRVTMSQAKSHEISSTQESGKGFDSMLYFQISGKD